MGREIVIARGRPAVIILALIVAAGAWIGHARYGRAQKHFDEAAELVRLDIVSRNARKNLALIDEEDMRNVADENVRRYIDKMARDCRVEIKSLDARGTLWGGAVFRIEYTVDGKPPETGGIEYYSMPYDTIIGWHAHELHRTLPIFYHLGLWR